MYFYQFLHPHLKPNLSVSERSLQLFHLLSQAGFEPLHSRLQAKHSDRSTVNAIEGVFSVMH